VLDQTSDIKDQRYKLKRKDDFGRRCYNFSIQIIKSLDNLPQKRACLIISDQLLRSAMSVGANFIEAKSVSSKRDYIRYTKSPLNPLMKLNTGWDF
jgi:four helix bundle protein